MEIYLVRHAKSAHDYSRWKTDAVRPLADKGRKRQKKASEGMKDAGIEFDTIWVSPFVRAQQTLELILHAYGLEKDPHIVDELQVWGDPLTVRELLVDHFRDHPQDRLLCVGHNPNMSDLVQILTGEHIVMSTSDLVHIRLEDQQFTLVKYYPRNELMAS